MADINTGLQNRSSDAGEVSALRSILSWGVHLLTASGVIWCLLALQAVFESDWREALAWLVVAVLVDAVDGPLARLIAVKHVLPHFDGALLDNLVDFASYVVVPALIIQRSGVLTMAASFWAACAICLASAYQFCQHDAKTQDHFFKGFPSYWNVTALYLLALRLPAAVNLAIVVVLIAMIFVPIKYIYVTRTAAFRTITLPLTAMWGAMALVILYQLPDPHQGFVWCSLLYVVYYVCVSVYLTLTLSRQRPGQ